MVTRSHFCSPSLAPKSYKYSEIWWFQKNLGDLSFKEVLELLRNHFKRKTTTTVSRLRFGNLRQSETQSIDEFEVSLRKESIDCKFGGQLDDRLKDQFILGVRSESTRKKLLDMEDSSLTELLKKARALEIIERDIQTLNRHAPSGAEASTTHVTSTPYVSVKQRERTSDSVKAIPKFNCQKCGIKNHLTQDCRGTCPYKCHKCHKIGHLASVCGSNFAQSNTTGETGFSAPSYKGYKPKQKQSTAKATEYDEMQNSDDSSTLNTIHGPDPVFMTLRINDVPILLEVDTGSRETIIPKTVWKQIGSPILEAAGSIIAYGQHRVPVMGRCQVRVKCRSKSATLSLIVSDLNSETSLLGRTWIDTFRLVHYESSALHHIVTPELDALLQEYADLFAESSESIKGVKATLHVRPEATFKQFRARNVPFSLQPKVDTELRRLEAGGIIQKVDIAPKGTTPIVPVVKPNESVRICGDFKVSVNRNIDPQQYPMPRTDELLQAMAHGNRFSKIDLSDAYLQVELEELSKEYLVITTNRGLYRYNRLPFGISAAPAIFQSVMDQIIQGLEATRSYLDDVSVTGRDDNEHLANLRALFARFRKYGVHLKRSKCEFMADSMVYLGHQVTRAGTRPVDSKCEAIARMPSPQSLQALESFLGMVQFYSQYIQNLASTAGPLNALRKKGTPWYWTPQCEHAFQALKSELSSRNLAYFDETLPVGLATDASEYGIGAVLFHIYPDGTERPIQYASKTLSSAERNYAQIE